MGREPTALIAGGSHAGLLTALALTRAGWRVHVFERSAQELKDRGAGIYFHPRLAELLRGAGVDTTGLAYPVSHRQFLARDGEVLHRERRAMELCSWNGLFELLRRHVPGLAYELGASVVGVEEGSSSVAARLADGRVVRGDLLVFADGIGSTGRRLFAPEVAPEFAGYVVWRGVVPSSRASAVTRALLEGRHTTCLVGGSHMQIYPLPSGTSLTYRINFIWYRPVEAGPELDDLLTDRDGVVRPTSVPPGFVQERHVRALKHAAAERLPPAAAELLAGTDEPYLQTIFDMASSHVAFGRACLVGDAGFVARPHLGAGTAKAAENAWALADALARRPGEVTAALGEWQDDELALGRGLVERSRALGEQLQTQDPADFSFADFDRALDAPLRADGARA